MQYHYIATRAPKIQASVLFPTLSSACILVSSERHVVGRVSRKQDSSSRQHRSLSRVTGLNVEASRANGSQIIGGHAVALIGGVVGGMRGIKDGRRQGGEQQ